MSRRTILFALLAMGLIGQPAFAVLLAYEGFDYDNTTTAVGGRSGGSGWSGGWINNTSSPNVNNFLTTDDVSITQPPSPFPPIGDRISKTGVGGTTGFQTVSRLWAVAGSGFNMGTDGTLYLSFSWTKTDGGTGGDNLEFQLYDSTLGNQQTARAGVTSGDVHFLTGASNVPAGDQYGAIAQSTKYFTVLKLTASASGTDQVQATNFTSTPPGLEPVTWDKTTVLTGAGVANTVNVNSFRLVMGMNAIVQFDELRVGTTWADVAVYTAVPEASSLAFMTLSALVGCRVKKKFC